MWTVLCCKEHVVGESVTGHIETKLCMLFVTSLTQTQEMFFVTFAFTNYLYRPFYRNGRYLRKLEQLSQLSMQLDEEIRKSRSTH